MRPLHHHFELGGWPETKVTARFWLASLLVFARRIGDRAMSDIFQFEAGETVLVIGLGRSGLASVDVLRERGVTVYATDEKPRGDLHDAIAASKRPARASLSHSD